MKQLSKQLLSSLGLTGSQAAVFFAALELGECSMQELARKSGIKRTSIYNFIDDLKNRGLVIETRKKSKKVYSAVDPRQLLEIEKMRLMELERTLPELLAIQNKSRAKPRVMFYDNIDGIKEVYADMLKEGQEILAFEDLEHMNIALPKPFYEYFPAERAKRGILFRSILRDSAEARRITQNNRRLLRQSKFVTSSDWRTEINIYGNKIALMSFRSKIPFCVLIEDQNIAETLRTIWNELWQNLKIPMIG